MVELNFQGTHHGVDPILQTSERTGCGKDAQDSDLRSCQDQAISTINERVGQFIRSWISSYDSALSLT